ncbi:MAG TPA: Smr/MutS family protein [Gaiellaceae bacterium]|jgi:DNA mismatch repair protein MutS2
MDGRVLEALEFPAVVERVTGAAATPRGREVAGSLTPTGDADEVRRRQALTAEGILLIDRSAEPPLAGIADVRSSAVLAARGGTLDQSSLAAIAATTRAGLRVRAALAETRDAAPLLAELAERLDPTLAPLATEIDRAVEDDGSDLRDSASPALQRLRKELRASKARAGEELRRLAGSSKLRDYLQENFVTERAGRPVLALKASTPRAIRGIVHDVSASGQTVFVEPFELVELNNRRSETAAAERDEVERILRVLSGQVGRQAEPVVELVEVAAAIDVVIAGAAVSRRWRGAPVEISDRVRLLEARHPLLDPASAVPIDLDLGRLRALVISGPNTGGKTVALKTLGLAALLHQSGLRPPALTAELPVFDRLLVDIGDPQSIVMSLSTFSGHVRSLVEILETATEQSLVLIDEITSGTDPTEGAALAQAVLSALVGRARLSVVTTHHPELKEWASASDDAINAATGFDPATHAPLYRIVLGRPGASHALRIAERLGLDEAVVEDARRRIAPERLRIEELLTEAESAEREAQAELEAARRERAETARLGTRARVRETELEAEREQVRATAARAREQAIAGVERDLTEARAELRGLRDEIRVAGRREREARRASGEPSDAARTRDRHLTAASSRAADAERALRALDEPLPLLAPLAIGDPVVASGLALQGTIASISGDEAEMVAPGGQRIRIALARLSPDPRGGASSDPPDRGAVRVLASARGDVSDQLDVRGTRAQETREAVRAFVDEASLAGLKEVRIVHGRGTGALRAAVREELDRHPLVDRRETESSDGATIVHLERPSD